MVPKSEQSSNDFMVLVNAEHLATYTLKIVGNEKNFNPKLGAYLIKTMQEGIFEMYMAMQVANNLDVFNEYEQRVAEQKKALMYVTRVICTVKIAKSVFGIKHKRMKYWLGLLFRTKREIKNWISSDKKRYLSKFKL